MTVNKNPKDIGTQEPPTAPMNGYPLTELGNAERLVHLFGENLRYCAALGFLVFDGYRWKTDVNNVQVSQWYAYAVRDLHVQAEDAKKKASAEENATLLKIAEASIDWAKKSEANGKRTATLEWTQRVPGVSININELDRHRHLLNCQNGTLDLRTGTLKPHDRADMITRIAPVSYNPSAKCPTWDAAMARWQPLPEVREFLARAFGYSLTGFTGEHTLFFLYGEGRNGKSIFTGRIENILGYSGDGGYAARIDFTALSSDKRRGGVTPELVNLVGARCVIASEPDASQRWSESTIKDLTGGDRITVNPKHRDAYEFLPEFKLWVYGNHKISISSLDKGIEARLPLIPFEVFIPEAERDHKLGEKLDAEAEGILAWAVRGYSDYLEKRLAPPASVIAATEEYHAENDPFAGFWEECCTFNKDHRATPADIYNAYAQFASVERDSRSFPSQKRFGEQLRKRGCESGTDRDKGKVARVWWGIGIKTGLETPEGAPARAEQKANVTPVTGVTPETNSRPMYARADSILTSPVTPVTKITKEEKEKTGGIANRPMPPIVFAPAAQPETPPMSTPSMENAERLSSEATGVVWERGTISGVYKPEPTWRCSYPSGTNVKGEGRTQLDALDDALGTPDQTDAEIDAIRAERERVEREGEPADPDAWLANWRRGTNL